MGYLTVLAAGPFGLEPIEPLIIAIFLALYFIPWIVAALRHHPDPRLVALLNLVLGWSVIGWFAVLVVALGFMPRRKASH